MGDNFHTEKSTNVNFQNNGQGKVIDEANYRTFRSSTNSNMPSVVGRGGDPLFKGINASRAQLDELLNETEIVQDWTQKEICNKVALKCLDDENLKDIYYEIKDGFGDFGPMLLMGFKNPQGVEIPRLKLLDNDGEVIEVLTGPMALDELNRRALAYKESKLGYEALDLPQEETGVIQDYSGNPEDYS